MATNNKLLDSNALSAIKVYVDTKVGGVSKSYTGLYTTPSDSYANANFYFIRVRPTTWQSEWSIRYKLECDLDAGLTPTDYQYMHSTHECYISGARGLYSSYAYFNNINYTSRRVIGYHAIAKPTETGYNNGCGYMIGISLYYNGLAYSSTSTSYKRTIKVTILETHNCTATLEDAPLISHNAGRSDYTKLNSTYYPYSTSDSNTAGYMSVFNAYSNGMQETGDDNSTDLIYYHNHYSDIGSFGLPGYTVFGYSPDGKVQAISLYQSGYTTYTTNINTARVYNTNGFDYTRPLLHWNSSGFQAGGTTNVNIHSYKTQVFDFRYTDNCVSTAGTTLSFVRNKEVYLRGTIGTDGLFYLAPILVTYNSQTYKRAWTQDIPTAEDGYVYWLIGHPYSTDAYQLRLYAENPLFWYKDGKFRRYGDLTSKDQTISGRKTFDTGPIIPSIYNSTKNGDVAHFLYSSSAGSSIVSAGHFITYGDDDDSNSSKPSTTYTGTDIDTHYFNTGITLHDSDGNASDVKLSFPSSSGTLALTSQIPSTSNFVNLNGTQTITGAKTFQDNCLTISYSGYGAPALKLTGSTSGYAGTTVLQAGTPGGATRTITLPSTDGTLALTSYVQANPGSGSTSLSTIKINGTNYYLSATANIPVVDIRS